jgi:hypothetical protein
MRKAAAPAIAIAAALLVTLAAAPDAHAYYNAVQQNAIRDGCKKFYNEKTQKAKYRDCVEGKSARSHDALIEGCYARYKAVRDKLRDCLGR